MVLDPFSALSIASSVIQVVDFASRIVSKGQCIYKSADGALRENAELETVTRRLQEFCVNLTSSFPPDHAGLGKHVLDLQEIGRQALTLSNELILHLDKLKVSEATSHRKWESFRKALKTVWSKDKVDALSQRLEILRAEVDSYILLILEERFGILSIDQIANFKKLDSNLQSIFNAIIESRTVQTEESRKQLRSHAEKIDEGTQKLIGAILKATINQSNELCIQSEKIDSHAQTIFKTVLETTALQNKELIQQLEAALIKRDAEKIKLQVEVGFLESMRFSSRADRYERIVPAYHKTFEWIFKDPQKYNKPWDSFLKWLSHESGIYWIQGKAASGKSTLMRFISYHPLTMRYLEAWASGYQLIVASFFFWNSGNEDQRSHLGLLRSLLYDVLRDRRDLIPQLFPREWERKISLAVNKSDHSDDGWSLSQLQEAFKNLISLAGQGYKFCFFIDGLDEHDGDAEDIAEYFKSLSLCTDYVKFCLSSRPWSEFQNIYQASPRLRLQELTHDDIKFYVEDKLGNNSQMQQLLVEDSENASWLIKEIVDKAAGVFLWVTLVIKALISGLRRGDEISHLRRRLAIIPPDLETLYNHMLKSIDPLDMEEASKIFQIFRASGHNLSIARLERSLRFSDYHQVIEMETLNRGWSHWDIEKLRNTCERLLFRLNSRTKGLLEASEVHRSEDESSSDEQESKETKMKPRLQARPFKRKKRKLDAAFPSSLQTHECIYTRDLDISATSCGTNTAISSPLKSIPTVGVESSYQNLFLDPRNWRSFTAVEGEPLQALGASFFHKNISTQSHYFEYENMAISYLHRTARDYLEASDIWQNLLTHTNITGFSPHTALLMGSVIEAKTTDYTFKEAIFAHDWGCHTLEADDFYKLSSTECHVALIKELDKTLSYQWDPKDLDD